MAYTCTDTASRTPALDARLRGRDVIPAKAGIQWVAAVGRSAAQVFPYGQRKTALVVFSTVILLSLTHSGCIFSGGVSTFQKTTSASGSGFLSATEQNGQWDGDGPPPRVGDVTKRPIYRKMEKTSVLSIGYLGKVYELTDLYPSRRRRIAAIRETGSEKEGGATIHYYEVEFDPETGG